MDISYIVNIMYAALLLIILFERIVAMELPDDETKKKVSKIFTTEKWIKIDRS